MPKRPQAYYRPRDLSEALALLARPDVAPLAGGTQLLGDEQGVAYAGVVDLQDVGLNDLHLETAELRVGATVTLADLAAFLEAEAATAAATPLLQKAIHQAGPNTYRNAATLGGVIAARLPDSELLAALLVLEAQVALRTPEPETMALRAYLATPERPSGLIVHVAIPWQDGRWASDRVARTPADYPIVSVTLWQPAGQAPRLAATGLAPQPMRLAEAEAAVAGAIDADTVATAAAAARAACTHPGDFRGDHDYRAEMAAVLTRRVLT